jgi:hypothetical protein
MGSANTPLRVRTPGQKARNSRAAPRVTITGSAAVAPAVRR